MMSALLMTVLLSVPAALTFATLKRLVEPVPVPVQVVRRRP